MAKGQGPSQAERPGQLSPEEREVLEEYVELLNGFYELYDKAGGRGKIDTILIKAKDVELTDIVDQELLDMMAQNRERDLTDFEQEAVI